MRAHLGKVMGYLLVATEEQAIAGARKSIESKRVRSGRPAPPVERRG